LEVYPCFQAKVSLTFLGFGFVSDSLGRKGDWSIIHFFSTKCPPYRDRSIIHFLSAVSKFLVSFISKKITENNQLKQEKISPIGDRSIIHFSKKNLPVYS